MPEPRGARSIIENAEQAAAAGNYSSAEVLLREAVTLQEQTLGPHHPDLANTLNNLGVVCEKTDNPIDAEHYFRRAYAIATATLTPDHPFVATSRKNLHDFCTARGRPVELPPSPPAMAAWLEGPAPPRQSSPSTNSLELPPAARRRAGRPIALAAVCGVSVLTVVLMMTRPWGSSVGRTTSRPTTDVAPTRETPAPQSTPPAEAIARPPQKPPQPTRSEANAVSDTPATRATSAAIPAVVTAQLCTALTSWQCEAADGQVRPGPLFFYTQLKSATNTVIEHRWYHGDRLHRSVQLPIQANPGTGYRTYSRTTISHERAGDWRVELRSANGTILKETRFTIR